MLQNIPVAFVGVGNTEKKKIGHKLVIVEARYKVMGILILPCVNMCTF